MITSITLNEDKKTYHVKGEDVINGQRVELDALKVKIDWNKIASFTFLPTEEIDKEVLWTMTIPEEQKNCLR